MHRVLAFLALAASATSAPAAVRAVSIEHKSAALDFSYAWPGAAASVSPLDWRLRQDAAKTYRTSLADAVADQRSAKTDKRPFHQHSYAMAWTVAGQTPRLLSLQSAFSTFTGGAHRNSGNGVRIWDRRTSRDVALASLFSSPAALASMRPAYCRALDAERLKRRQGEKLEGEFADCPEFSELAIAPVDANHDGRFDHFAFVASPYVAGPYVEGEYEITLPVTGRLVARVKAEYRPSFAAQRQ